MTRSIALLCILVAKSWMDASEAMFKMWWVIFVREEETDGGRGSLSQHIKVLVGSDA